MKCIKLFAIVGVLALASLFSVSANGQTANIVGAGSSAVFQATLDDAINASSAICGSNHWTLKNGGVMWDNRQNLHGNGPIQAEVNNVWITWNGPANGSGASVTCIYVSVDSGIGVRGFMANPRAAIYLNFASCTTPPAPGNLSLLGGDVALPTNICNVYGTAAPTPPALGVQLNIAFSDVRPEDVQFQSARALSALNASTNTNYGYGNWPNPYTGWDAGNVAATLIAGNSGQGGETIKDSYSTSTQSLPVWYELSTLQDDAISGDPVQSWTSYPVGAIPVLILASNQDNSNTGFGNGLSPATNGTGPWTAGPYAVNNVNTFTLGYLFDGSLTRTIDLYSNGASLVTNCSSATAPGGAGSNDCSLAVLQREVFSGTYTTFEWCIPHSHAVQLSQEDNVLQSGGLPVSPLQNIAADGSRRLRTEGTGEMVNAICGPGATAFPPVGCNESPINLVTASLPACVYPQNPTTTTCTNLTGVVNPNRVGYAFWSYGNLKALRGYHAPLVNPSTSVACTGTGTTYDCSPPLAHYLTVNGVEPLFATSSANPDGALNPPICTSVPCPTIPFTHLIDGTYPIWTIVQAIVPGSTPATQGTFITNLAGSTITNYSDFLAVGSLNVFRSHRDANVEGKAARNGNGCGIGYGNDLGQSAGGAIFNIQNDLDYLFDTTGLTNNCVGTSGSADAGLVNINQ